MTGPPTHDTHAERVGTPRSPAAAERLARFERNAAVPLVLAALLPILLSATEHRGLIAAGVYLASWIVFLVDFVVHQRLTVRFLGGGRGSSTWPW